MIAVLYSSPFHIVYLHLRSHVQNVNVILIGVLFLPTSKLHGSCLRPSPCLPPWIFHIWLVEKKRSSAQRFIEGIEPASFTGVPVDWTSRIASFHSLPFYTLDFFTYILAIRKLITISDKKLNFQFSITSALSYWVLGAPLSLRFLGKRSNDNKIPPQEVIRVVAGFERYPCMTTISSA